MQRLVSSRWRSISWRGLFLVSLMRCVSLKQSSHRTRQYLARGAPQEGQYGCLHQLCKYYTHHDAQNSQSSIQQHIQNNHTRLDCLGRGESCEVRRVDQSGGYISIVNRHLLENRDTVHLFPKEAFAAWRISVKSIRSWLAWRALSSTMAAASRAAYWARSAYDRLSARAGCNWSMFC